MDHQKRTGALLFIIFIPTVALLATYSYYTGLVGGGGSGIFGTIGPCYSVTVIIEYGNGYGNNGTQTFGGLDFPQGATVFDALTNVTNVDYQYYGSLVLVTGINGVHNNPSANLFWQYYVNGAFGPVASNVYHLSNNSVVEWRYQASQFG